MMRLLNRSYSYSYLAWSINDNHGLKGITSSWGPVCPTARQGYCGEYGKDLTISDANYNTPETNYNTAYPDQDPVYYRGSAGGKILYQNKDGIERFFITDINNPAGSAQAQSTIPLYLDGLGGMMGANGQFNTNNVNKTQTFNHVPGGCNVLYMDGHVEFLKYPGKFPVSHFAGAFGLSGGGLGNWGTPDPANAIFAQYQPV
jgi:prepilin-type processing-associated H-X9-DG protein